MKNFLIIAALILVIGAGWYAWRVKQSIAPTDQPPIVTENGNVKVTSPAPYQEVGLPLQLKGSSRVFEGVTNYRLKNADGSVILEDFMLTQMPENAEFVPFEAMVYYPEPSTETGTVEVFEYSAKDGSEINKVSIPISFQSVETISVKVFFNNLSQDPDFRDCTKVFAVDRRIPKTSSPATAAVQQLLKGPTGAEQQQGFETNINRDTQLNKLTITNGIATADFSEALARNVAGSCRVMAVTSQIENTLQQFSSIRDVVITVEGKSAAEVLQP
jgi:hypothetical protein